MRRHNVRSRANIDRLISRVKRYEELLKHHGLELDEPHAAQESDSGQEMSTRVPKTNDGQMIEGRSRYVEK